MPRSDKGTKRASYDNSTRARKKTLADIARAAQEVARKENQERKAGRPRAERRQENREADLPQDRRCPICGNLKLKSKQWVVGYHDLHHAICLSCKRRLTNGWTEDQIRQVETAKKG